MTNTGIGRDHFLAGNANTVPGAVETKAVIGALEQIANDFSARQGCLPMNATVFKRDNGAILLAEKYDLLVEKLKPYGLCSQARRLGGGVPAVA